MMILIAVKYNNTDIHSVTWTEMALHHNELIKEYFEELILTTYIY